MRLSRRNFLASAALSSFALGLEDQERKVTNHKPAETKQEKTAKRPVLIASANGRDYLDEAYTLLRRGGDTLDAAMIVLQGPENDPKDDSVGLGGLPNEEGEVELDACCMHGPTRRAGAVAGVREIKNVSLLAKAVMEHSGHVMLVGEGALQFGLSHGFPEENLLTDRSRKTWLLWKETHSQADWWGPGLADPEFKAPGAQPTADDFERRLRQMEELAERLGIEPEFRTDAIRRVVFPPTGTVHCSVINEKGEMSGATSTSGLAWKLPGRAGDTPIIGAGCYTDQDVGSAGATGNGEENIKVAGAHTIVENMRRGMSPQEAGLEALKRIARNYNNKEAKLRFINMTYYVLRKDGAYAGVSLWSGPPERPRRFAVHDGTARLENCVALFKGAALGWPPVPTAK